MQRIKPEASLSEIYAALPEIHCQRKCQECCGPVIPNACLPEEQRKLSMLPIIETVREDLTCGALMLGSCSIYSNRPLICRLWGCVEAMRCPWGCEPEFWLTDREVEKILRFHKGSKRIGRLHVGGRTI